MQKKWKNVVQNWKNDAKNENITSKIEKNDAKNENMTSKIEKKDAKNENMTSKIIKKWVQKWKYDIKNDPRIAFW